MLQLTNMWSYKSRVQFSGWTERSCLGGADCYDSRHVSLASISAVSSMFLVVSSWITVRLISGWRHTPCTMFTSSKKYFVTVGLAFAASLQHSPGRPSPERVNKVCFTFGTYCMHLWNFSGCYSCCKASVWCIASVVWLCREIISYIANTLIFLLRCVTWSWPT